MNTVFLPTSGNWNAPANWSLGATPTPSHNPILLNGRVATVDANAGTCATVFVGQGTGSNPKGTMLVRPGGVLAAANLLLGRDGTNVGLVHQSGGSLTVADSVSIGDAAGGGSGASGEFTLSAGTLRVGSTGGYTRVGHLGVGRLMVCGGGALTTPVLFVGNGTGSSGSRLLQWGGAVTAANVTVGASSATNCTYALSAGSLQWSGLLLVRDTFTVQGGQGWIERTNAGGVGLQVADGATLRCELAADGIAPLRLPNALVALGAGSRLVVDGSRYVRWNGRTGSFPLVTHRGYSSLTGFAASNVVFTGFGELAPALRYETNGIFLDLAASAGGLARLGQGVFCEAWELPINNDEGNRGQVIHPPLGALPAFTNSLMRTHPVFGRVVSNLDLSAAPRATNFVLRFTGFLLVPTNGTYTFQLNSDDGSMLWLDGALVVTNDGAHAAREISATTNLTAGPHALMLGYFQNLGSAVLELRWSGPGFTRELVPADALALSPTAGEWVRRESFRNVIYDHNLMYNYAPSFMYDETEGLYKIWCCASGGGVTGAGDYVIYKEAASLEGLLGAPLQIALGPSLDPAKFDQLHACDPNVYRVGELFYLTYSGNTDNTVLPERTRIGMAISYDRGRTFQRLHGGAHVIEPNTNTYTVGAYGAGQSAVVRANDGYFYMIYTDADGGSAPLYQRVVRGLDPAFPPGSFTNVASFTGIGNSVDLAYDATHGEFLVVNGLTLLRYDANWQALPARAFANPFAWSFGEGHALLSDSLKRPVTTQVEGVPHYHFAASVVEDVANTTLWANWVEGDLKYLACPLDTTPGLASAQVLSAGLAFAGNSATVLPGATLGQANNFTVDSWVLPQAGAALPHEATNGAPGLAGQRYVAHPEHGGTWGTGHAGMGVSVGRNGIGVFEHAGGYLPSLLTWFGELPDWTHVAVVYADKTPSLYVNGRFVRSGLRSPLTWVHPTARNFGGSVYGYFAGRVWNYRVWNRPLTAEEIATLPSGPAGTNLAPALIGQWLQDPPLAELSSNGTPVMQAVVAGATDGPAPGFFLTTSAEGRFAIGAGSGAVVVADGARLDYETVRTVSFTVGATNGIGFSAPREFTVTLTNVNEPPSILGPADQALVMTTSTGPLPLLISDPETSAGALTLTRASTNLTLVPLSRIVLGGSGSNRTVTVTPVANLSGSTRVTLTVNDGVWSNCASFNVVVFPNRPPAPLPVADHTLMAGQTLAVTNAANDPDAPPQTLTWSLLAAPAGALLEPATGVFTWRPGVAQSPRSETITLRVADNGVPVLSATQSFDVTVLRPAQPVLTVPALSGGRFALLVSGDAGPDYDIFASTNLVEWSPLVHATSPSLPFVFEDSAATNFGRRFYRVRLGPD